MTTSHFDWSDIEACIRLGKPIRNQTLPDLNAANRSFANAVFYQCDLRQSRWHNANLVGTSFIQCNLDAADFQTAVLNNTSFINGSLNESQWSRI